MRRIVFAMAALAVGVTAVVAQSDVIVARRTIMKANGQSGYVNLNKMVRDQMPYDQAKVDEAFAQFIDASKKMPALFPPNSYTGPTADDDYYTSQKAFENKSDLEARFVKLGKEAEENKDKVKDLTSLKAIWPKLKESACDGCHEPYRVKKG